MATVPLFQYTNLAIPPIHIVVKNGRVILKGVVDNDTDKKLVGMLANQVPGAYSRSPTTCAWFRPADAEDEAE